MSIFNIFRAKEKASANIAKERLQIIVAHQRGKDSAPDYLPNLQRDIVKVLAKYVEVSEEHVNVSIDNNGGCSVLELNITLPEKEGITA